MYGAMREHAPQSTRLAGAITAATMTLAFGYALANGMRRVHRTARCPMPIIYVPLPDDDERPIRRQRRQLTLARSSTETRTISFRHRQTSTASTYDPDPSSARPRSRLARRHRSARPPHSAETTDAVRTGAKMLPADAAALSARRASAANHQGTPALEVCLDTGGRVTSASLASISGHASLDQAALKWVRTLASSRRRKLDGAPQAICGHRRRL